MAVEFDVAGPGNRQALYETVIEFWNQRWDPATLHQFLDWRFIQRPGGETLVVMDGEKCLGMIDTFMRPYRMDNEDVLVREPCDWFCRPEYRGLGLRLMRFLNQQAEPQLGVGMPASAIAISRRMKWTKLTGICDYTLRLSVRRLAATALRRLRIGNGSAARFIPPGLQIHSRNWQRWDLPGGEVRAIKPDDWPLPPATGYGLAPICTKEYFAWLSAAPAFLGKVFGLIFHRDGCPAGFSVCRVEPSFLGTKARIIHIHAFQPDAAVLRWMLAANVAMAVELGAEFVLIRSTCPVTQAALADLHFQLKERDTVILNWGARAIPQMPVNVTYLRGDDAMIPGLIGS